MLFNSFPFAYFFLILLPLYWLLPHRGQNLLLLAASYFFYGCWDPRFLSLLVASTVVDYGCGLAVDRIESPDEAEAVRPDEHGAQPGLPRLLQVRQLLRRGVAGPAHADGPARRDGASRTSSCRSASRSTRSSR